MDYLAHPRSKHSKTSRKFQNDTIIQNMIKKIALNATSHSYHIEVERIYLEQMNIKEQYLKMNNIDILIGVHGAGLTHLLFLNTNSIVIEIMNPSKTGNNHYKYLSIWCDHTYLRIYAKEISGRIEVNEDELTNVVKSSIQSYIT